mgnify:CR=1 FL=1
MLKLTVITGALGGLIVLAITPFVMKFASLNDTAMHYLKYMLLINTYYIMGSAVNTALIAGVFRAGGDTKFGLICDTVDMWVYAVPLGFLRCLCTEASSVCGFTFCSVQTIREMALGFPSLPKGRVGEKILPGKIFLNNRI